MTISWVEYLPFSTLFGKMPWIPSIVSPRRSKKMISCSLWQEKSGNLRRGHPRIHGFTAGKSGHDPWLSISVHEHSWRFSWKYSVSSIKFKYFFMNIIDEYWWLVWVWYFLNFLRGFFSQLFRIWSAIVVAGSKATSPRLPERRASPIVVLTSRFLFLQHGTAPIPASLHWNFYGIVISMAGRYWATPLRSLGGAEICGLCSRWRTKKA